MFWGSFASGRKGLFKVLEKQWGTMNLARFYLYILWLMHRFFFELMIDWIEPLLMQDSARCYWSLFTRSEPEL